MLSRQGKRWLGHGASPLSWLFFLLINGEPVPLSRVDPASPLEKPILETTALALSHRHKTFSLQFAGIHFANPYKQRYAFRLEGYDDWVETDRTVGNSVDSA